MNDKEKQAYVEGFAAKWDLKFGVIAEEFNPYDYATQPKLYNAWQEGFQSFEDYA